MSKEKWKYKLRKNYKDLILATLAFLTITCFTLWGYYVAGTGRYPIFCIIFVIVNVVLILFLWCGELTSGLWLHEDEFYHREAFSKKKRYYFKDIEKIWTSYGEEYIAHNMIYRCIYKPKGDKLIKFDFHPKNYDVINFFRRRVREEEGLVANNVFDDGEYIVDGSYHTFGLMMAYILFLGSSVMDEMFLQTGQPPWVLIFNIGYICYHIFRAVGFKIKIEKDGFYFRTTPFNERYYKYSDVVECEESKEYRSGRRAGTTYCIYEFTFTDKLGKVTKFEFAKSIHKHEIEALKYRIDKANNKIAEE